MKKRKDGLYAAQIYLGSEPVLDGEGKPVLDKKGKPRQRRKYKTIYDASQKKVKAKANEMRLKLGKGIDITAAEESFSMWAERFIKSKEAEGVGHSHLKGMKGFNSHLEPIQKTELSKVTAAAIQSVIDSLALYHDGKKPLSKRTLTGVKQFAGQVYKMAIGARVVDYNPAEYVKIPKTASVTHRNAITEEQQEWIKETPHRVQTAAMIMLYSGVRIGEALALTWADVDLDENTIHVSKAVSHISNQPHVKAPKTRAGVRIIDIPETLTEHLRGVKANSDCVLVLHMKNGRHFTHTAWYNAWNSYMRTLQAKYKDFERFTPHQLRHTFCTILYAAGYSLLEARDQMGHKDIQTTANIYTHLDKLSERKTKGRLTKYLCKCDASKGEDETTG